jgi:hypothetical protein
MQLHVKGDGRSAEGSVFGSIDTWLQKVTEFVDLNVHVFALCRVRVFVIPSNRPSRFSQVKRRGN